MWGLRKPFDGVGPSSPTCAATVTPAAAVQLSDAALQEICDDGQTAACQVVRSRTGDG